MPKLPKQTSVEYGFPFEKYSQSLGERFLYGSKKLPTDSLNPSP